MYVCGCVSVFVHVCVCVFWLKVESSQQPAEESSPLRSKEADEEVDHSGGQDDARRNIVQVVQSLLIGHHV